MPAAKTVRKKNGQFNGSRGRGRNAQSGSFLDKVINAALQWKNGPQLTPWEERQVKRYQEAQIRAASPPQRRTRSKKKVDDRPVYVCGRCRIAIHDLHAHNERVHDGYNAAGKRQ